MYCPLGSKGISKGMFKETIGQGHHPACPCSWRLSMASSSPRRASGRARMRPLEYWANERVVYEMAADGVPAIAGVLTTDRPAADGRSGRAAHKDKIKTRTRVSALVVSRRSEGRPRRGHGGCAAESPARRAPPCTLAGATQDTVNSLFSDSALWCVATCPF